MRQALTIGLAIVVLVTATTVAFIAGRLIGINSFTVSNTGITGKSLLYLNNNKAVRNLALSINLQGTVVQKEQDALLIKEEDSSGVWATLYQYTVFEEQPLDENREVRSLRSEDINIGDKVTVLGRVEGETIIADAVIRQK